MSQSTVANLSNIDSLDWYYDSYHLLADENGQLVVIQVDGSNKTTLDNNISSYWLYNLSSVIYRKNNRYYDIILNF